MLCAQKRKRVAVSAATATALAVIAMHWTLQKVQEELDDLDAQFDALHRSGIRLVLSDAAPDALIVGRRRVSLALARWHASVNDLGT